MCRSIVSLRSAGEPASAEEIHAAALQYVRKVSGYRQPSRANEEVFSRAVEEVAGATARLLAGLTIRGRSTHDAPGMPRPAIGDRELVAGEALEGGQLVPGEAVAHPIPVEGHRVAGGELGEKRPSS